MTKYLLPHTTLHYKRPGMILPVCMQGATVKTFLDMNFVCAPDNEVITCEKCLHIGYNQARKIGMSTTYGKINKP